MIMVLTISGSDTDTVGGGSDGEVGEILEPTAVETPVAMEPRVRAPVRAFARLDAVDLHDLFESRCLTSSEELFEWLCDSLVRKFLRGWKPTAKSRSCGLETLLGSAQDDALQAVSGRNCFPEETRVQSRVSQFQEGDCLIVARERQLCRCRP